MKEKIFISFERLEEFQVNFQEIRKDVASGNIKSHKKNMVPLSVSLFFSFSLPRKHIFWRKPRGIQIDTPAPPPSILFRVKPLHIFVTGNAGCDKTFLTKILYQWLTVIYKMSMVPNELLLYVYLRLVENFGCTNDASFPGVTVIAVAK